MRIAALIALLWLAVECTVAPAEAETGAAGQRQLLSLDGPWQIVFDRPNVGRNKGWHKPDQFARQQAALIRVPSCWEETERDYEGVAWYARTFSVPSAWKERHVRLRFGAVNYIAEVWLNGRPIGRHEGGYTPFEFDVTPWLEHGAENVLIVRVVGPAVLSERVDTLVRNEAPHWRGAYVGGIWQSVALVASDPVFVRDVFVEPRRKTKTAVVHAEIENATIETTVTAVTVTVTPADRPDRLASEKRLEATIPPGGRALEVPMPMEDVVPWSPEVPQLYNAQLTVAAAGKTLDASSVRFGMREFTIRDGHFYLNGKRLFIKGAFWEGVYPATLAHPRDEAIVRREIAMAKEAGFNLLRPWRHPMPPAVYDLCDEMGMLLIGSPAVECMGYWPAETPQLAQRWTSEMVEMVRRDRNHPSIICWETANEIIRKSMLVHRHGVSLAARRVDPTRLIIDESGGSRAPWGAGAYLPYSTEPLPIVDRHIYRRSPVGAGDYRYLASYGEEDKLTFMSEVGYGGMPDLEANVRRYDAEGNPNTPDYRYHHELLASLEGLLDEHDLRRLFPTVSSLARATQELQAVGNKLQLEALRINPKCDGYCLHAFTGGDWVLGAGVLDIWREPKLMYDAAKEVQTPVYLAVRVSPENVYAARGAEMTIVAVNEGPATDGRLTVSVTDASGIRSTLVDQPLRLEAGIRTVVEEKLDTAHLEGRCTVRAVLRGEHGTLADNRRSILVFAGDELKPSVSQAVVIEPQDQLQRFFADHGVACTRFQDGRELSRPVLVAQPDAWNSEQVARFVRLMDWVKRGGVAVWLKVPSLTAFHGQPIYTDLENNYLLQLTRQNGRRWWSTRNSLIETGVFPMALRHRTARGNWIPVVHYARPHAIFDGLPLDGFMDQPWHNVAATRTLENLPGRAIAGSVSWDVEHDCYAKMWAWHGTDLAVVDHGEGKMILSMMQVVEHLGRDPVADKLLWNMLRFAESLGGPTGTASADLDRRIDEAVHRYRQLRASQRAQPDGGR